ncbi:hypothetical protein ACQ86G_30260 [Roseateles chitinivorans]|uniref:hypothetical protein n=1 Tax=Roseateles chitinivorans TaxID=2917965 RepID=UPI003D675BA3
MNQIRVQDNEKAGFLRALHQTLEGAAAGVAVLCVFWLSNAVIGTRVTKHALENVTHHLTESPVYYPTLAGALVAIALLVDGCLFLLSRPISQRPLLHRIAQGLKGLLELSLSGLSHVLSFAIIPVAVSAVIAVCQDLPAHVSKPAILAGVVVLVLVTLMANLCAVVIRHEYEVKTPAEKLAPLLMALIFLPLLYWVAHWP